MTKTELIKNVAGKTGYTQKVVGEIFGAVVDEIITTVAAKEDVSIAGMGKFYASFRAAREGRNPATGETMMFPDSYSPKFKAGKAFKDAVKDEI